VSNPWDDRFSDPAVREGEEVTGGEGSRTDRLRPRVVLRLAGELDVRSATAAHKRLLGLALRPGAQLVLDLSGVTFMDSTGIRLILQAREHALRHGAGFVVVRGPAPVMRVLELVGLDGQLDLVSTAG
jgi:anti-anti-sigma factor